MFGDWLAHTPDPEHVPDLFRPGAQITNRDGVPTSYPEFIYFTHLIVASIFPYMTPTNNFPEAKCRALRLAVADSMAAIEELFHFRGRDGWLRALLAAVRVCSADAEGRVTDFVHRLNAYLKGVVRDGCLLVPEMAEQGLGLLVAVILDHPGAA